MTVYATRKDELAKQVDKSTIMQQQADEITASGIQLTVKDLDTYKYLTASELEMRNTMPFSKVDGVIRQAEPQLMNTEVSQKKVDQFVEAEKKARKLEAERLQDRSAVLQRIQNGEKGELSKQELSKEYELKVAKIAAIEAARKMALSGTESEERILYINMKADSDIAAVQGEYARLLPENSYERRLAMNTKERLEVEAYNTKKRYSIFMLEKEGKTEEATRERKSFSKHSFYDHRKEKNRAAYEKKVTTQGAGLSHEDAMYITPDNHHLVNIGRAFYGGTKRMYIFEDRDQPILDDERHVTGYKRYLYKEASDCLGNYRPAGAIGTAVGSKLQKVICGQGNYIPSFVARTNEGVIIGSFQEEMETWSDETTKIDLYSWQEKPEEDLEPEVQKQVLREHTLDWMLCNFDTKGENFLHKKDGGLVSLDKEAGLRYYKKGGAQTMSVTYAPHTHESIYNILFRRYRDGEGGELDLDSIEEQIIKIEEMTDEEYLSLYREWLRFTAGPRMANNKDRLKLEEWLLKRKANLREEYKKLLGDLLTQRRTNLRIVSKDVRLGENGKYLFPTERAKLAAERQRQAESARSSSQGTQSAGERTVEEVFQTSLAKHINVTNGGNSYNLESEQKNCSERAAAYLPNVEELQYMPRDSKFKKSALEKEIRERDRISLERIHDLAEVMLERHDSFNANYYNEAASFNSIQSAIVRKDITGSDRLAHIEKYKNFSKDKVEAHYKSTAEEDYTNLLTNLDKDFALKKMAKVDFDKSSNDLLATSFLAATYLSPVNAALRDIRNLTPQEEYLTKLKANSEIIEKITVSVKSSLTVQTAVVFETKYRYEAAKKALEILRNQSQGTEYEKYMITLAENELNKREYEYNYRLRMDPAGNVVKQKTAMGFIGEVNRITIMRNISVLAPLGHKMYRYELRKDALDEAEKADYAAELDHIIKIFGTKNPENDMVFDLEDALKKRKSIAVVTQGILRDRYSRYEAAGDVKSKVRIAHYYNQLSDLLAQFIVKQQEYDAAPEEAKEARFSELMDINRALTKTEVDETEWKHLSEEEQRNLDTNQDSILATYQQRISQA